MQTDNLGNDVISHRPAETYARFPALSDALPPLVRKQRRLEATIALVIPIEQEMQLRKDIDTLLATAGLARNDAVTCLGYDVTRRGQNGRSAICEDTLIEPLVVAGLARQTVLDTIKAATKTGEPSAWAEVKPSKGARVRR
jgi:hypothetical protein